MASLYDEHAAVLWRYAIGLTGDASSAEDVVRETLLRAWQHPEVVDDAGRSARASLFTIARSMMFEPRRLVVADAMARLSAESRAVIERSCYGGWTTAQIATDLGIAEETVKTRLHHAARALRLTLRETGMAC
jgi:RNA polymerase sigma-70 factor (ECF subfamily)